MICAWIPWTDWCSMISPMIIWTISKCSAGCSLHCYRSWGLKKLEDGWPVLRNNPEGPEANQIAIPNRKWFGKYLNDSIFNSYISIIYYPTLVITKLHWWRVSHLSLPPGRSWCGLFFDCDECMRPAVQMESCWDGKPVEWTCREGFLFSA